MNAGKVLVKGAALFAALLGGVAAVDRAATRAQDALEHAQKRRREYTRSVQRHYAGCFARADRVLAASLFDHATIRIAAYLPLQTPEELRRRTAHATPAEKLEQWQEVVRTVLARTLLLPSVLALVELSAHVQAAVVAGQSFFAAAAMPAAAGADEARVRMTRAAVLESILRAYNAAYESLRSREYAVRCGLAALVPVASRIAREAVEAHTIARTLSYSAAAEWLQGLRARMDAAVLAQAPDLVAAPPTAPSTPPPDETCLADTGAAVDEFLGELSGTTEQQQKQEEEEEEERGPAVEDTVCELLLMNTRAAAAEPAFAQAYVAYADALWGALLASVRALFVVAPGDGPAALPRMCDLPLPKLALRLAALHEPFAAQQATAAAVAALRRSSVRFDRFLFTVFLQQQQPGC